MKPTLPVPPIPSLRRSGSWLLLACLALFLPGFATLPPTDRDESRFAQASRQMREDGDYLHIRFQDRLRLKKPPGIYWLQSAAAGLAGSGWANPIWPYRLPSLLGALAAVLATAALGARMADARAGVWAGALLAMTVLLGVEARLAKTDAILLAAVVAAQAALWSLYRSHREARLPSRAAVHGFWIAQAAAILVKGPIAPLVSGLTLLTLSVADRDGRIWRALRPWWGVFWLTVLMLPWLLALNGATDGAFLTESLGRDLLAKVGSGQESHGAPPGTYLLLVPLTLWPTVLLLPPALLWTWRLRMQAAPRFLLAWALPVWLVFELIPTKLPHYILPALPALCLMAALAARPGEDTTPRWTRRLGVGLWALGAMVWLGVVGILPVWLKTLDLVALELAGGLLGTAALLLYRGRSRAALGLSALMPAGVIMGLLLPHLDGLWPSREVARQLQRLGVSTPLIAAGYTEPSLVFWLGRETTLLSEGRQAAQLALHAPERPVLVSARAEAGFLAALAAEGMTAKRQTDIRAYDLNGGGPLRLTLYQLPGREAP
jgi:4-amino-4-deoxy-L-arabinose transferase-like glycosyltransferase